MSKTGTLDLASGLGGKIDKKEVISAVDQCVFFSTSPHSRFSSRDLFARSISVSVLIFFLLLFGCSFDHFFAVFVLLDVSLT